MNAFKAFGVGIQDKWPWPAVIVVGFGLVGFQVVTIPTIAITYAIDCYKPISGEIMAIATVCKNTFGVRACLVILLNCGLIVIDSLE